MCHHFGVTSRKGFIVAATLAIAVRICAQTPARPTFEVASVKLNTNCGNNRGGGPSPGRLSLNCTTLNCTTVRNLIQIAYTTFSRGALNPKRIQVVGGPAWLDTDATYR